MQNYVQADDVDHRRRSALCRRRRRRLASSASCSASPRAAAASGAQVVHPDRGRLRRHEEGGDTFAVGDKLYWDDTNKYLTSTSAGNKWVGVAISGRTFAADTTVRTRLNGFAQ
jgi:predicted RecA/RadA family phage recombinase